VDGTKSLYIDHDVYETIYDFSQAATHRGITLEYHHFFDKHGVH
jgi:hypothetical protein